MNAEDKILILADNRIGTYSQAVALAKESGHDYEIFFLEYNFLKFIPNIFFSESLIRLSKNSLTKIKSLNYCPKYIISAGRKSAPIAINLKKNFLKKYNFSSKVIQIMRPEINFNKFDFVIIPQHDKIKKPYPKNLIFSIGALSKIEINHEDDNYKKFYNDFKNFPKPIMTLLVGGDNKNKKFSLESAKNLIKQTLDAQNKLGAFLVIMNSRRTSTEINFYLQSLVSKNIIFYDYNLLIKNNPYYNILSNSDYFIITGDSVSMISECCNTGKPVYIFYDKSFCTKKHHKFHQILVKNNYANFFNSNSLLVNNNNISKLEEAKRISAIIF